MDRSVFSFSFSNLSPWLERAGSQQFSGFPTRASCCRQCSGVWSICINILGHGLYKHFSSPSHMRKKIECNCLTFHPGDGVSESKKS